MFFPSPNTPLLTSIPLVQSSPSRSDFPHTDCVTVGATRSFISRVICAAR